MSLSYRATSALAATCILLAGCSSGEEANAAPDPGPRVESEPSVHIGSSGPEGEWTLFGVVAVRPTSDGGVVVGNAGSESILVFDASGSHRLEIGRAGDGPGEFQGLQDVRVCQGDRLVAWDASRVSIFSLDGSLLESVQHPGGSNGAIRDIAGVSADCDRLLFVDRWPQPATADSWPHTLGWSRLDGTGDSQIREFKGRPMSPMPVAGRTVGMRVPFGPVPAWSTNGRTVALGLGIEPEVLVFGPGVVETQTLHWPDGPDALTASTLATAKVAYEEGLGDEAAVLPGWDDFPIPDIEPAHAEVLVSETGGIWVQDYPRDLGGFPEVAYPRAGGEPQRWHVFGPAGAYEGRTELPSGFELLAVVGDAVWGVVRDDLDVESVRSYRIVPE